MFGFLKRLFKQRKMGMQQGFTIREAPGPRRPYPPPSVPPRPNVVRTRTSPKGAPREAPLPPER